MLPTVQSTAVFICILTENLSLFVRRQKNYLDLFLVIAASILATLLLVRIVRIYSANTQFLRQHCSFLPPANIGIFSFSSSRLSSSFTHLLGNIPQSGE
jgi:hypothetical protein